MDKICSSSCLEIASLLDFTDSAESIDRLISFEVSFSECPSFDDELSLHNLVTGPSECNLSVVQTETKLSIEILKIQTAKVNEDCKHAMPM